jgi:heme exporter protein CcmD
MNGVIPIDWGWEYVWTAYGVTAVVFAAYVASVLVRYNRERRRP